jgi:hypothetical protein
MEQRGLSVGMFRWRFWKVASAMLLFLSLQLFCEAQSYAAPQMAMDAAAAAKEAAGREARSHGTPKALPPNGTFISFDAPGAVNGTFPVAMNSAGAITGQYIDGNSAYHGFLRNQNGTLVSFDVPGASMAPFNGTSPEGINDSGAITGGYGDNVGSGFHGFVLASNGDLSTFDAPDAAFGTEGNAINAAGSTTGFDIDANSVGHGFLRNKDGSLVTFDARGAVFATSPKASRQMK